MYHVIELADGRFECRCRIRDGTEYYGIKTREEAAEWMVGVAAVMKDGHITTADIQKWLAPPGRGAAEAAKPVATIASRWWSSLADLAAGRKVLVAGDDRRLKYRITDEECETILLIREGRLDLLPRA